MMKRVGDYSYGEAAWNFCTHPVNPFADLTGDSTFAYLQKPGSLSTTAMTSPVIDWESSITFNANYDMILYTESKTECSTNKTRKTAT